MKQHDIITVNGQAYDTVTGLPVAKGTMPQPAPTSAPQKKPTQTTNAHSLHATTQRSKTLRRTAPKPSPVAAAVNKPVMSDIQPRRRPGGKQSLDIARHPQVNRLAPAAHTTPQKAPEQVHKDISPRQHPHAVRAQQRIAEKQKQPVVAAGQTPKETKEKEIAKALSTAVTPNPEEKRRPKLSKAARARKLKYSIIFASIVIVAAVTVWVNLPAISVAFASAQSGVNANYPHFTPDGYTLTIPVTAESNRVTMTFSSNQNNTSFSLSQEKSSWDSQAVRSMVEEQSKGQFLTTQDRGLTIYTYDGNAAWVNKGILYKLSGDSRLSNDAIMRIASSL